MVSIVWNQIGKRFYETGIDRVVLYPKDSIGVPWRGVMAIDEKPDGGEVSPYYLDGIKFVELVQTTDYQATLTAFMAPAEFRPCDGIQMMQKGMYVTQQPRKIFGLAYRTMKTNDLRISTYKIHLVHNAMASPSDRQHSTLASSVEPLKMSWSIDAVPPPITNRKPSAHMVIDSAKYSASKITQIENLLYGTVSTNPQLPTQSAIAAILGGP